MDVASIATTPMISQMRFQASPELRAAAPSGARSGLPRGSAGPQAGASVRSPRGTAYPLRVKAGRMRYRPLGNSGLLVSVVGLGCNNFGRRLNVEQTRAVVDAAIDAGVTLLDTAESYGGAGRSEEILGEVLEGRRDRVVLATKFGRRRHGLRPGGRRQGQPRLHPARRRAVAAPAAHRLHRPVPDPHARSGDADRGDAVGAHRSRPGGPGPVRRPLQLLCSSDRYGGRSGPRDQRGAVHLGAESLVAAGAAGRARRGACGHPVRARRAALLPAGQRPADRQDPARRRAGRGHQAGRP